MFKKKKDVPLIPIIQPYIFRQLNLVQTSLYEHFLVYMTTVEFIKSKTFYGEL